MHALSNEEILKLIGGGRSRNQYAPPLQQFLESDEATVEVVQSWPILFSTKSASTIYQGFANAVKKGDLDDKVLVKKADDNVFLVNREKLEVIIAKAAEAAQAATVEADEPTTPAE